MLNNIEHLHSFSSPQLNEKEFRECCEKLIEFGYKITDLIYKNGSVVSYYDCLYLCSINAGQHRTVFYGCPYQYLSTQGKEVAKSKEEFLNTFKNIRYKYDIYGNKFKKKHNFK